MILQLGQRPIPEPRHPDGVAYREAAVVVVYEDQLAAEIVRRDGERKTYLPAAVCAVPVVHHLPIVAEELHIDPAPPRTGEDTLYAKVEPVGLISYQRVLSEAVQLLARAEHRRVGKVVGVSRFETAGEDGVRQILTMGNSVTALICAYDNIAFGAIKELKKAGLRVPDDVSVIGMDNINTGKYADTSLTTIDSNPEQVCTAAWNLLNEKIKNPYLSGKKEIINAKLIIRESIARCNTIISETTLK